MNRSIQLPALLVFFLVAADWAAGDSPTKTPISSDAPSFGDGTFTALEPMPGMRDPVYPKAKWFHENTLTIKGREATLNKNPIFFDKGKRFSSASDGGFFTYRGTLNFADGGWHIELILTDSDYVGVPVGKDGKPIPPKPEKFIITRMKDGSFVIDKLTYRKSNPK